MTEMGSVYRRRDGRWAAAVMMHGRRVVRYARTRSEAKLLEAELNRQRDLDAAPHRLTLADFLAGWLRETKDKVRHATYRQREMIVRVHLNPVLGRIPLRSLSPAHVSEYQSKKGRTLHAQTVRHHRSVLRRALNVALARGLVQRNAAALSDPPRLRKSAMRTLTTEQVRALLDGTRDDRLHALYVLAATTGLRQAELLGLAWDDVDLDHSLIRVRSTLHRQSGEWVLAEPKNESSVRAIALMSEAVEALRQHRVNMAAERQPSWKFHGLVFVNVQGDPIYGTNLLPRFYRYLSRLGLPRIPWHGLRHSAASMMLEAGVPIEIVSKYLGHSSIRTTLDIYGHLTERLMRTAAEGMERALSRPIATPAAVSGAEGQS